MVEASLQKTGVVTNPIKNGTGKATMQTTGAYTPGVDNQYIIQIDSGATEGISTATFKWSRNDTVIASGVVTDTAFIVLESGVQVRWSSGLATAHDAFGSTLDQWTFEGKNLFGINQMIDRKRNTRWRSSSDVSELHDDTNAMADPAGVEADSTGVWRHNVNAAQLFSTNTTVSEGSFALNFQATPGILANMNWSTVTTALTANSRIDISFDISLKVGAMNGFVISGGSTDQFVSHNTTGDYVSFSRSINLSDQPFGIKFEQQATVATTWFLDNLSIKIVPSIVVDLGASKEVNAIILQDHNLTSNAEITLKARGDTAWELTTSTSEPFEETITWEDDKILHYVSNTSNTQRFWRLDISDTGNPDGFIEVGDLFLGPFDEMVRNAAIGYSQTEKVIGSRNIDVYGVEDNRFRNRQKTWKYTLPASTDILTLEGVFDNIYSSTDGKYDPVWINPTSDSTDFHMVFFDSIPLVHDFRENKTITLNFREVLKSN